MNMELKDIQELVKLVAKSGVSQLEVELKGVKVLIKNEHKESLPTQQPVVMQQPVAMQPVAMPQPVVQAAPAPVAQPAAPAPVAENNNYITFRSPMIGTFYRSPGPGKDVFVNVGDDVAAGKVVCIIEAMKLFNEIEIEVSGRIVKVLVDDATPVEYDQPLFLIEP